MTDGMALFRMEGISKRYGGVHALEDADLKVHAGRVHAILGENGAGKSTLIKVMSGVVAPDEGRMFLDGREISFPDPAAANRSGIVCIFQELSLIPDLTVADNIVVSNPPTWLGLIDHKAQRLKAEEALAKAGGEDIHPRARVGDLPLSRQQIVEIAKALARQPRVLILDEATSALTASDVTRVMSVLKRLRTEGMALLYISHRMHEIAELADECTVFRNGRNVESYEAGAKSDNEVVEMMIGREYKHVFPEKRHVDLNEETPALEVRNLSWLSKLNKISLSVLPGEIVGLGGLDGQGQRELLLALFGVLKNVSGEIVIDGKPVKVKSPRYAKSDGINMALIPEDRKTEGLMLPMSVLQNLSFAALGWLSTFGVINRSAENSAVNDMITLLGIRSDGVDIPVSALSGGNQQKVVIAKWLMISPKIVLLNDPTRGIDVGTKQELYQLMRKLSDEGAAIILYSTDYDELIGCCHKVMVMYDGEIRTTLSGDEITEHALVGSALNITPQSGKLVKAMADYA